MNNFFSKTDLKKRSVSFIFVSIFFSAQSSFASQFFLNIDPSLSSNSRISSFIESTLQKLPPAMLARFEKDQVEIGIKLSKMDQTDPKKSDEYASVQEIENKKSLILLEPYFVHSLTRLNLENMTVKDWLIQRQIFYGRNPVLPKNLSIPKHKNAKKMIE